MLDTLREVETPEGVALSLRCAGVVPRALAWLLDLLVRGAVLAAVGTVLGLFGQAGKGVYLVCAFVVWWGYPIAFEVWRDGQTPGKRSFNLKVVCDNGTPVTWLPSLVRTLFRTIDMLPMLYVTGVTTSLIDSSGRRLGDLVAGTVVVYTESAPARPPAPVAAPLRPPLPLRIEEQRAIIGFAERAPQMTPERQAELAETLQPITAARGGAAVAAVLGLANYLLGRR
jgi:uncharacterized RDD family membrane protein YckC